MGRVLAEDLHALVDVPPQANSAMDGYAVRGQDLHSTERAAFKLLGTALAGHPYDGALSEHGCVRIMTGAPMPEGADTVVPQELADASDDDQVHLEPQKAGANVRHAGEDSKRGDLLCARGKRINAGDIGYVAAAGNANCMVYRPLRIAILSTGDELQQVGTELAPGRGRIYDSNRHSLRALLTKPGFVTVDCGLVEDRPETLRDALLGAAAKADAVITSGGVSVGTADYVRQALEDIGRIDFWKVAIKPGRPLAFGQINSSWFFGLPGNPVSVHVTLDQLVMPVLRHISGEKVAEPARFTVRCVDKLRKRPGRVEYQRGVLRQTETGETVVSRTGEQGSGIMASMSQANCYIVLDYDCADIKPGEQVTVQPFNNFFQ